jgi:hypothetical protein
MSYVLVERQGNYNDEIMYLEEGDGGTPVCVLFHEDKAIEHLDWVTKEKLKGFEIGAWCYNPEQIGLPGCENERADLQITGEYSDMIISKYVTDENLKRIMDMLDIEFFQLFNVDDETGEVTIYNKRRKIFQ